MSDLSSNISEYVLEPLEVAGINKVLSVLLSFRSFLCPSFCSSVPPSVLWSVRAFTCYWIVSFFLFCARQNRIFWENKFPQKVGMWVKNFGKIGFLKFIEKSGINIQRIYSIMNTDNICCVSTEILYLEKILWLRFGSKTSKPIRLQIF